MTGAPQPDHQSVSVQEADCDYAELNATHIFSADLPPRFFHVQLFCDLLPILSEPHNYVTLDRPQRAYLRCPGFASHGSDSHFKRCAGGRRTIVRQLAVIQITLEQHEVRMGKMQEQVWRLRVQLPKSPTRTPERVLFVDLAAIFRVRSSDTSFVI